MAEKWVNSVQKDVISLYENLDSICKESLRSETFQAKDILSLFVEQCVLKCIFFFKGQTGKHEDSNVTVFQFMAKIFIGQLIYPRRCFKISKNCQNDEASIFAFQKSSAPRRQDIYPSIFIAKQKLSSEIGEDKVAQESRVGKENLWTWG